FFSGTHAIACALFAFLRPGNELAEDGGLDWDALSFAVRPHTKCALIQRSCGYSWRQSLSIADIERAIRGADLIAGSLIKNPGGTIAPCGGYVAGKRIWVEAAAARLSAPGLGVDCGSMTGDVRRALFQGLFLSPQMVGEAIKAVQLGGRERLISFCEAVQRSCPIGSYIKPTAGVTTGYASEV
ncbi:hypothetical protein BHE74_00048326, partial [Ensete ventricosum]